MATMTPLLAHITALDLGALAAAFAAGLVTGEILVTRRLPRGGPGT
jgi:hypothetical protein